jgi:hypothetical protein
MLNTKSIKKGYHQAGKSFVLMFNRVSMYGPGHPFSVQAVDEFYHSIQNLLQATSPVVLIYTRNQFYLEDEPIDRNLNFFKMASHFKKTDVTSISIEKGLQKDEVENFVKIFLDPRSYPGAEAMRNAAAARQVRNIRINHIFYQKVTEDDQVVAKSTAARAERLDDELNSSREVQDALSMIAGKFLMEELDQSLSLKSLMADPGALSRGMVEKGLAESLGGAAPRDATGQPYSITRHLGALGAEIRQALAGSAPVELPELAEALLRMKRELLREIEAQKAVGLALDPNNEIREEAESVTDTVILELIRKEYDKGRTPVERLAFILERILPFPEDLARLLPGIRDCLLGEGMPLSDFSKLIQQIGVDRQNEGITQAVARAADDIGVDGDDILERLKANPSGFTRLLYLAAEIEKESGSSKPLSDILIDHIERIAPKLAGRRAGTDADAGEETLRRMIVRFNSGVVDGLREGYVDARFVGEVERRLQERLEASVAAIRSELSQYKAALKTSGPDRRSLLQSLEDGLPEGHALKPILRQVGADFRTQKLDENDFQEILERIDAARKRTRKAEKKIDEVVFSKKHTLALLEIELARAGRYGTDLSAVAFSIYPTGDRRSGGNREAVSIDTTTAILQKLREKLRNTDWIGIVSNRLFLAVMPMTTYKEAHLASRRLLKSMNAQPVSVSGRPVCFKIAGSVIHYDSRRMPDSRAFIRLVEDEHVEVAHRLRNLQDFM